MCVCVAGPLDDFRRSREIIAASCGLSQRTPVNNKPMLCLLHYSVLLNSVVVCTCMYDCMIPPSTWNICIISAFAVACIDDGPVQRHSAFARAYTHNNTQVEQHCTIVCVVSLSFAYSFAWLYGQMVWQWYMPSSTPSSASYACLSRTLVVLLLPLLTFVSLHLVLLFGDFVRCAARVAFDCHCRPTIASRV